MSKQSPPFLLKIGALWFGPMLCWSVLAGAFIALRWSLDQRAISDGLRVILSLGFGLLYAFVSPLLCGFCTAYFRCRSDASDATPPGFWPTYLVLLLFAPCCVFWVIIMPLHLLVYDIGFTQGMKFWSSERPRQWIGDCGRKDNTDEAT